MEQFVDAILELIRGELKTSKVTHVEYGEVKSVSPLKISIDQKLPLSENMLFLSKSLTDYDVDIDVGKTGTKVTSTVHNSLKVGEVVSLVSFRDGQKYLVIDRV